VVGGAADERFTDIVVRSSTSRARALGEDSMRWKRIVAAVSAMSKLGVSAQVKKGSKTS
jgi:hypothetical protein